MIATESDAGLLEKARNGDADALVRAYLDDVYRVALRVLRDADLAADATQDAFVNAMVGLSRFRGESSVRTWLLRIAINAAHTVGRRRSRRREVALDAVGDAPARGPRIDERVVARVEVERAERALAQLPEKQRLSVALRIQDGLSYAEIGEIIGSSEAAARVNYHYGVRRLREVLGDDDAM
ncbi:MAG TPA: sigma-70 family RNA polymerase sigma factor [Longimicrobiales bacterium]